MAAAPAWQRDVPTEGARGGAAQQEALGLSARKFQDVEALSRTFGHVADVSKDYRRDAELHDLLASTSKEDTYQQHFQGWPSLLRPLSPAVLELPSMVQDKYRACQAMCFCGLFPQIRRAWASVDNSLFLWRYDKSTDVPLEYCGEDQAISCVGLAAPRPGVFLPAIRYIIVLCTTAEIVLLGVCPSRRAGGAAAEGGDVDELSGEWVPDDVLLQPLPLYSIPTDNVLITCCASGPGGRVFLGGADGHVYELSYHAADTWRHKRISKIRLTSGLQQYLPSFVPSLLGLGAPPPIERLVVDRERHILYALNAGSGIQVFDLATSESTKLHLLAVTADGRRIYFTTHHTTPSYGPYGGVYGSTGSAVGGGAGAGGGGAGALTASGLAAESAAAAAAAAAAAGPGGGVGEPPFPRRPETLMAVFARAALPHAGVARGPTADLSRSAALEIVAAHYSSGCLLLSESAAGNGGGGGATKLLAASRNTTVPPATLNTHTGSSLYGGGYGGYGGYGSVYGGYVVGGLRESVTELDNFVPGETCAVEASPCRPLLGPEVLPPRAGPGGDELGAAVWWRPPRFSLIGTAGVLELEKRRPVELLVHILERNSQEQLRSFFQAYGAVEAAAMCYMVATAGPPVGPLTRGSLGPAPGPLLPPSSSSLGGGGVSAAAARGAAAALENPLLVGEARMPEDAVSAEGGYPLPGGGPSAGPGVLGGAAGGGVVGGAGGAGSGMYMGRAVDPNPGPAWSTGHRGLCLYVARLLAPVYDKKVAAPAGGGTAGGKGGAGGGGRVLTCRFSGRTLEVLEDRLLALAAFLETTIARRQQKGYAPRAAAAASSAAGDAAGMGVGGGLGPFGGAGGGGGIAGAGMPQAMFGGAFGGAAAGGLYGGPYGGGGAGGGAEDAVAVAHKRRRLEHAAQQEDDMAQRIRSLVLRVAEACSLLRLLSRHNLGRLAVRQLGGAGAAEAAKLANLVSARRGVQYAHTGLCGAWEGML
ncbi:hypothetical protein GPECTOR_18g164 [Gonium pectorale]|uniref:Nucleoporin Nup133/Nup155-like N-terminal domain-containing protein n=1 Tax=Gonium pectorale TaxID=33097 RepID=A0A150GKZ1_GONPE|nr:hypothetical protein GPECTOR_18g164 [Gonium pectorale]|eukprot:KXZ50010.1 hypothetical protein GPECTOR_18g164 [Gonium pectorale]